MMITTGLRLRLLAALPLLCAVVPLSAQATRVVPPGFEEVEGNSLSTYPLGRMTAGLQILCDPNVVAHAPGFVLEAAFRIEGSDPLATYAAYTKQYVLTAAQTTVTAAAMATDPVANHNGATPVTVFAAALNVPASAATPTGPRPFSIALPFNAPFTYDPANGGLLLTLTTNDSITPPGTYRLDAANPRNDRSGGIISERLLGCANALGQSMTLAADATQLHFGGALSATLTSSAPGSFPLAAFLLGFQHRVVDLGPLGMTGCSLGLDIAGVVSVPEVSGSYAPVTLAVPGSPALEGGALFGQVLGLAPSTGSLVGSVASNVLAMRIGNPGGGSVWSQSMFATDPVAGSWFMGRVGTYMPVLELRGVLP